MDPELDRRRQIYKNIRKEIDDDEKRAKENLFQRKMTALGSRVAEQEQEKKRKDAEELERAQAMQAQKRAHEKESKNLLDNIQAF